GGKFGRRNSHSHRDFHSSISRSVRNKRMDNIRQHNERFAENRWNRVELGNNPSSPLRYLQRPQVEMVGIEAAALGQGYLPFVFEHYRSEAARWLCFCRITGYGQ